MKLVYVVPGLTGSQLFKAGTNPPRLYWLDPILAGSTAFTRAGLDADGVHPDPVFGWDLYPDGLIPGYYDAGLYALAGQMYQAGYTVRTHAYDWRLDPRSAGHVLADRIRAEVAASGAPCRIAAHSLGSFVVRQAYADLVATGDDHFVASMVFLGAPTLGSYSPCMAWACNDMVSRAIAQYGVLGIQLLTTVVRRVMASWPSLYCLMPFIDPPNPDDPDVSKLFFAENWTSTSEWGDPPPSLSHLHLANALRFQAAFSPPASTVPPRDKVTSVAGTGYVTAGRTVNPYLLGDSRAFGVTSEGDGDVTVESALALDGKRKLAGIAHNDLLLRTAISGDLATWLLDDSPAPPRPDPPEQIEASKIQLLAGPPLVASLAEHAAAGPCSTIGCTCIPPG